MLFHGMTTALSSVRNAGKVMAQRAHGLVNQWSSISGWLKPNLLCFGALVNVCLTLPYIITNNNITYLVGSGKTVLT